MRRRTKIGIGVGIAVALALVLFLLPVVPMSVEYACWGPASMCPTPLTHVSVTYAAFSVGAVYISGYQEAPTYCWMNGNPVTNPSVDNGAMCGIMIW